MTVMPKVLWKNGVRYGSEWQKITDFEKGVSGNLFYTIKDKSIYIMGYLAIDKSINPTTQIKLDQHGDSQLNVPLFTLPNKYKYINNNTIEGTNILASDNGYGNYFSKKIFI